MTNSYIFMFASISIFCRLEIVWYFIHVNILKSYDFMCNYNIESKHSGTREKVTCLELIL